MSGLTTAGPIHILKRLVASVAVGSVFSQGLLIESSYAGQPRKLEDAQLDTVYAEGLAIDFSVAFGSINDAVQSQLAKYSNAASNGVVYTGKNALARLVKDVSANSALSKNTTSTQSVQQPAATTPITSSAAAPSTAETALAEVAASTAAQLPSTPEEVTSAVQSPSDTLSELQNDAATLSSATQVSAAETVSASDVTADSSSAISAALESAQPVTTDDLGIVSSDASTINTLVVDDYSQQYLSSLVNVNAAGSVVPVLLNIVININSTVENVNLNNSLDLSSYYRYQIR